MGIGRAAQLELVLPPYIAATPPPTGSYIIKPCPGAPAGLKCTAGTSYLSRFTERFDVLPYGCCACRKIKAGGPTTAIWSPGGMGYGPFCDQATSKSVPANTIVHFTGNIVYGYSAQGCPKNDYAEIILPDAVQSNKLASWFVPLADLSFCNQQRKCVARAELGAACDRTGCCTVAAEGGHPDATCYFPWNGLSACGVLPQGATPRLQLG